MTDERVERAFRQHPDFETTGENEFRTPEKPFPGEVAVIDADASEDDHDSDESRDSGDAHGDSGDAHEYRVVVRTPTLDAVVEGETVAEVVHSGWFETLELRLEDAHAVTGTDSIAPPSIEREGDDVVVTVEFTSADPEQAAEDALAIVEYVEGTWVQGIIPGYDYGEPAASLRERAMQNYDEGDAGGAEGAGDPSGAGDAGEERDESR